MGEKERLQEYLGERYRTYLEELPNEEWVQAYKAFCKQTQNIASSLESIDSDLQAQGGYRKELEKACQLADLDLDRYVIEAVYDRGNGVSSLGQGGLAQGSFEKVTCDDTFWKLLYQAIQLAKNTQCDKANVIYTKTIAWMEGFAKTQKINRFSAVVNRLVAPQLTVVSAPSFNQALECM